MSGYSRARKYRIIGGVVLMPWDMLNSFAYKILMHSAAKALPFFLGKVKFGKKSGMEYGSAEYYEQVFKYPFHEGKEQGFASATFQAIIEALIDKGFVDPVSRGGKKSDGLGFSRFRLSARWKKYGTDEFVRKSWDDYKVRRPRIIHKECIGTFVSQQDAKKYFSGSKTEIEQVQKRKWNGNNRKVISKNEAVGAGKQ